MKRVQIFGLGWGAMLTCAAAGLCSCGGGSATVMNPITVMLVKPTVTVQQGGPPVIVSIVIQSPSETAQVNLTGLPPGVGVTYAASDTNPSGLLTITATAEAPKGTFMPTVSVQSAGKQAATSFTLVVVMR